MVSGNLSAVVTMRCFLKYNALYEAGLQHDILNLLHIENLKADIAVKVNNVLSEQFSVINLVMQGSVANNAIIN